MYLQYLSYIMSYRYLLLGGWLPSLLIHTTVSWSNTMFRYMRQKSYCYRIDTSLAITLDIHKREIGTGIYIYIIYKYTCIYI